MQVCRWFAVILFPCFTAPAVVAGDDGGRAWNALFDGREGWIGGDGAYSVTVGTDRVIWFFGDTLWGQVNDGRRAGAKFVNNSIGIQRGQGADVPIRFLVGHGADGSPRSFFVPSRGRGWFWPQAPVAVGKRLFLFLAQIEKSEEPGVFGFRQTSETLAAIVNPLDPPEDWRIEHQVVPFADFDAGSTRSWGSAVLVDGPDTYIYGYIEKGHRLDGKQLIAARAPSERLDDFRAWQFWTGRDWSTRSQDAGPLAKGFASEFSISRRPGGEGYVAVLTENGLGARIVERSSTTPLGPWSEPAELFVCPEMEHDHGVFCYAAKAHPWANLPLGKLLVSYCVNTWDFGRLFQDAAVYRPKFREVSLPAASNARPRDRDAG